MKPYPLLVTILCTLVVGALIYTATRAQGAASTKPGYPGTHCKVQFRRDALGGAAPVPVPPTTDNINGASVSINGIFRRMHEEWVIIDQAGEELWIQRAAVLSIKFLQN